MACSAISPPYDTTHTTKMRRISRIDRSIDLLRARAIAPAPVPYLCRTCKQRTTPFSTSALRAARPNEPKSFSEKLRRKIWGTDNPPGPEDPYSNASIFDETKKTQESKPEERRVAASADLGDYEAAVVWDGLEKVGGFGNWWKDNWDAEHQFKGFMPPYIMNDPAEITASLRRAVIEVFALRQAGQPMDTFSTDEPGQDLTHEVKLQLSESGYTLDFGNQTKFEDIVQSLAPVADGIPENDVPTESEEDVAADRSTEDPLDKSSYSSYDELVASWDPSWLQISLDDPNIKFAVSY